ncbi:hypothetical protein HOT99_gp197 [Caulobacter phage CcrBL10]|uniref:Uncharacterized protein n=1 Tax=Caulobacter phage CcrBL10 TaxID=2283269 RepID=A0A385E9R1_9CAUD|nr:hypothetical protein HOT99_gp197 [Caulobacter phage CcrBL10]AXQ68420.1 hypothetical protein CcrBL10_gp216c [Caulobacter phage CcrBL10]
MQTTADLIAKLNQPGARLRVAVVRIKSAKDTFVDMAPTEEQGAIRGVVEATPHAIYLDNGKMLPIGCVGQYIFDGSEDRFTVDLGGISKIVYEIAQGAA